MVANYVDDKCLAEKKEPEPKTELCSTKKNKNKKKNTNRNAEEKSIKFNRRRENAKRFYGRFGWLY